MAYSYDSRPHDRRRNDSYYSRSRDSGGYSSLNNQSGYSYSSPEPRYAANPPLPKRSSARPYYSESRNKRTWPPSPSVEDEAISLAREYPVGSAHSERSGEAKSRGSVDQYPIIEEIEQPRVVHDDSGERRFVLVSDPGVAPAPSAAAKERRKSFAERGNIPHLKTDVSEPPVFTQRTPTPYAYTKPTKESAAPPASECFLSPEPITPTPASIPSSIPKRNPWDTPRDQNARPTKAPAVHSRNDSVQQSPRTGRLDVFDDSDMEPEDTSRLRTERTPAQYSFVKSDLQREDLRSSLHDCKKERKDPRAPPPQSPRSAYDNTLSSPGSSKNSTPPPQSPQSSSSSLSNGTRQRPLSRPSPVDTGYSKSSRTYPDSRPASPLRRPSSPLHREVPMPPSPTYSPKLPPRRANESPPSTRPTSRGGPQRPASPLSFSTTLQPPSEPRVPVTDADWHATYPPATRDRSRPPSRYGRHESMPLPVPPRIDVQSPSPGRPPRLSALPYPVDDRETDVYMPPEEAYQYQHTTPAPPLGPPSPSLRQPYPDSPKLSSPVVSSPREASSAFRPSLGSRHTAAEEVPRLARVRSNSIRSQSSNEGHRKERTNTLSLDKPLPSCPRSEPSTMHDDWYTLDNCPNFDICPSCFERVFIDTPFAVFFKQARRYENPVERFCDFSSPWMRLAWLLTIKQQRKSPDLLYALATITEFGEPCPKDKEVPGPWYGIVDQRDGSPVPNFTMCPCDFKQVEALFPSLRGYFIRIPSSDSLRNTKAPTCSLRITSRRFPKYLDLLVELDAEAQLRGRSPNIERFILMARENAYKGECLKDKPTLRKPWHFIPSLPEFTVCEECYDDVIWPAIKEKSRLAESFNRTIQLVPGEDIEGTSCCLYSTRMRRVWARALESDDFGYLKRKAIERKRIESRIAREKKDLLRYLEMRTMYGGSERDRLRRELREVEAEWRDCE
ncbi:uncharacterized protein BDR25DRAFT_303661 [Lindgomyces ingoldianus]|uniref:Uncharacterized protein n=1 Tax=Lindgomyces ingoldianus TaxID=673940 RepID=A0ACB6QUK5_9PLEO|nr:uncharacterized protein BDR25DRAFT_303661 [Lindgomyces ingoldianus]KAF2470580.1 hypothetical protein BDR25DRAFT_303661 [Lindgomyces ingoldianus]